MQNQSELPLGKGGINTAHDGLTEASREYVRHKVDVSGNHEANRRAVLACNAPTSTVGVTLGRWTE